MISPGFAAWLGGITLTDPFTLEDARALYTMIKAQVGDASVDVYTFRSDPKTVCVCVAGKLVRSITVV